MAFFSYFYHERLPSLTVFSNDKNYVHKKLETWKEYIEQLFEDNIDKVNLINMQEDEGPT